MRDWVFTVKKGSAILAVHAFSRLLANRVWIYRPDKPLQARLNNTNGGTA
ncbi:MAG: hypothetical protein LBR98_00580 [Syntrophomonadaceae bacterium]|nr:hypothetical protein [Syntrophomonadaceae bacterium]